MNTPIELTIYANQPVKSLGNLFGIFFEDLNHAADGGLYAEMVQNRSFEYDNTDRQDYHALTAWNRVQRHNAMTFMHVETTDRLDNDTLHYLVMDVTREGGDGTQKRQAT